MSSITSLNRKRGNIKGQVTRIEHFVDQLDTNAVDIITLNSKLASIEKLKITCDEIKFQYYDLLEDADLSDHEQQFIDLEDQIENIGIQLTRMIHSKQVQQGLDHSLKEKPLDMNWKKPKIRLLEIPLPVFSGKYGEWNTFKERFNSLIACNEEISDIQRLHYLQAALTGDAKQIQTSEDTFTSLMKALEERYSNRRLIIDSHVHMILNLRKSMTESSKDLQHLIDIVLQQIRALKLMNLEMNEFCEVLLINVLINKLDSETRKHFEMSLDTTDVLKWENFMGFLQKRCRILESLERSKSKQSITRLDKPRALITKVSSPPRPDCHVCSSKTHTIYNCEKFKDLDISNRYEFVKRNRLCFNCLRANHSSAFCRSKKCNMCNKKHHVLLHSNEYLNFNKSQECQSFIQKDPVKDPNSPALAVVNCNSTLNSTRYVLLSTAIVYVYDEQGILRPCRALLDSTSQSSFMTVECANSLGIKKQKVHVPVAGLTGSITNVKQMINASLVSLNERYDKPVNFLIVPKITGITGARYVDISRFQFPTFTKLADPQFNTPNKIDMLLGAEVFFELLRDGQYKIKNSSIHLKETVFGWVVSGMIDADPCNKSIDYCHLSSNYECLDNSLRKFWELESIPETGKIKSEEEMICEKHFIETHRRDETGRYVVQLPLRTDICLGDTRKMAEKRLNNIRKRLDKTPELKRLYWDFINEYKSLGHLERIDNDTEETEGKCYLPHHGVFKHDSRSTKLRVVFDASAISTSGYSLNSILLNGGVCQDDLVSIILRFRTYKYVFSADIVKMYRQILVKYEQCDLQRILWKENLNAKTEEYRLLTITYGTKAAPYLATRVLNQLALDEQRHFPMASAALISDTYVDDILTGSNRLQDAIILQQQLISMLDKGGMKLHKWCSNNEELIKHVNKENQEYHFEDADNCNVKTLGLIWNSIRACFRFKIAPPIRSNLDYTKRLVLSEISRIFDPLGLLGPITVFTKLFLKTLWLLKLEWDTLLPPEESKKLSNFMIALQEINTCYIPRYILADIDTENDTQIELHGFSDASGCAYGATIYLRCISNSNDKEIIVHLLCSKSRVAPIKVVSIPRLELCSAVLLSHLVKKVVTSLKINISSVHLWSDSTITLTWIQSSPHLLKTFVANRVVTIQELTNLYQWHHVDSKNNPADMLSRGLQPDKIKNESLWWHGPGFLMKNINLSQLNANFKSNKGQPYIRELKKKVHVISMIITNDNSIMENIINKQSNYLKIIRIVSYILRFCHNIIKNGNRKIGPLTQEEMKNGSKCMIKYVQQSTFNKELICLKHNNSIPPNSKLKTLHLLLDKENLIRVGGRLSNALLNYDQRHQIILPAKHKLVHLLFEHYHKINLRVGPQTLLHLIRQEFWPLNGRAIAAKTVHNCVKCFRARPVKQEQLMGDLPKDRVRPNAPFDITGIDFCGPFHIKIKGQRKSPLCKIYVAVFICFVTKAIHLDIVNDLTADAFLACLKRFFARRGKSSKIYTDNATNFTGAHNELKRLQDLVRSPEKEIANYLSSEGISWNFIPPASPHFGGLWEAGVKSFKFHLKRTVGNSNFTYEEFNSILVQIEGILNSRPISPLSSNFEEFDVLTPGHFLVGRPLNNIEEPELLNLQENLLSRWQRTTRAVQTIWNRWHRDYLNHLQQRSKWQFTKNNVKKGDLVIIKENNTPTLKWPLGRIITTIEGNDGNVRVVMVKSKSGIVKRSISQICILPISA